MLAELAILTFCSARLAILVGYDDITEGWRQRVVSRMDARATATLHKQFEGTDHLVRSHMVSHLLKCVEWCIAVWVCIAMFAAWFFAPDITVPVSCVFAMAMLVALVIPEPDGDDE